MTDYLDTMTLRELRHEAAAQCIPGASRMTRDAAIAALRAHFDRKRRLAAMRAAWEAEKQESANVR